MISLTELGIMYMTDKAMFHGFTDFYDEHFKSIRDKKNNILEIGILMGSSIKMLHDYFHKSTIHAIDIHEKTFLNNDRIKTYICDQSNMNQLSELFRYMQFDLIIDDGGHTMEQQQVSFWYLWNKVKSGGMYVIEDLHTSLLFGHFGYNKPKETTLDMVQALRNDTDFSSDFINELEFKFIKSKVKSIHLFTKPNDTNEFKNSITCVIYKK